MYMCIRKIQLVGITGSKMVTKDKNTGLLHNSVRTVDQKTHSRVNLKQPTSNRKEDPEWTQLLKKNQTQSKPQVNPEVKLGFDLA